MTIIPTDHIIIVLVTSAKDLAKELIYLVTVTPHILKEAIEKIPKSIKINKLGFNPASEK